MLNIIKNDGSESDLNDKQLSIVQLFHDQYELTNDLHLFETMHGHIVHMYLKKPRPGMNPNNAARLYKKDIEFLADIFYRVRWIEFHAAYISIGLKK